MFRNLSIKTQLVAVMGLMGLLLVGIGALGLDGIATSNERLRSVYEGRLLPSRQLAELRHYTLDSRLAFALAQTVRKPEYSKIMLDRVAANSAKSDKLWAEYAATQMTPEEKQLAAELVERRKRYASEVSEPFVAALRANDLERMEQIAGTTARPLFIKAEETLVALLRVQLDTAKAEHEAAIARYGVMRDGMIGAIGGGLLLAGLAAFFLLRGIVRPLDRAIAVADAVAAGDLTARVEVGSTNETGRLLQALARMNRNLAGLVGEVRAGVDAIGTGSREIASGNAELSQRTEEQASSLEETAASMQELASTVKQNADNARQANELANGASQVAVKGGEVVGQVVETMASINEASNKIANIIGVIDGIAFQTNILALNAAVEAARAGEQGRGFAVVASEVRTLAQRSAAAAREIKELIVNSVEKVGNGTKLVDQAGRTMDEIVASVKRVTDIMGEISAATHEQSSGIEQVNSAVMQMDQVTQQNAALVEEAAAAAESMREQAAALGREVAVFKLAQEPVHAVQPAQVEPAAGPRVERRGADRAKNVTRLAAKKEPRAEPASAEPRKTGTGDGWTEF